MTDILTPAELYALTGEESAHRQYEALLEIGVRPIYRHGKVMVYREAICRAMVSSVENKKPRLNL